MLNSLYLVRSPLSEGFFAVVFNSLTSDTRMSMVPVHYLHTRYDGTNKLLNITNVFTKEQIFHTTKRKTLLQSVTNTEHVDLQSLHLLKLFCACVFSHARTIKLIQYTILFSLDPLMTVNPYKSTFNYLTWCISFQLVKMVYRTSQYGKQNIPLKKH